MIKSFQGLRVIAMLLIFFFHFKIYGQGIEVNIYNKLFSHGYFAVTFFFILSGFLTFKRLKNDKFYNKHKDIKLKNLSFIEITLVIIFTIQYLFLSKYVLQAFKLKFNEKYY